ncbi:MAG: ABC transporter substrate-binding protein [Dehalococcoidia bacterium]
MDGAWAPEPWATRLELEAGGAEFLDEKDMWPDGKFVTTNLIVRTEFLEDHQEVVERLLRCARCTPRSNWRRRRRRNSPRNRSRPTFTRRMRPPGGCTSPAARFTLPSTPPYTGRTLRGA